jgi:hypothetical protein
MKRSTALAATLVGLLSAPAGTTIAQDKAFDVQGLLARCQKTDAEKIFCVGYIEGMANSCR